jgi:hypothetical protein
MSTYTPTLTYTHIHIQKLVIRQYQVIEAENLPSGLGRINKARLHTVLIHII